MFNRRKKQAQKEHEVQTKEKARKEFAKVQKEFAKAQQKMLEKYCPINKSNCTTECVHYHEGSIFSMPAFHNFPDFWTMTPPKCKLWS